MKRIVFISSVYPNPKNNGKRIVLSGILEYLLDIFGINAVTFILVGEHSKSDDALDCNIIVINKPGTLSRLKNLVTYVWLKRTKSIQECMLFSRKIGNELNNIIEQIQPDIVICDTLRIGQFFETGVRPPGRYIMYMDDLFSVRYEKMLEVLKKHKDVQLYPLGNFKSFVPVFLQKLIDFPFVQKKVLELESSLIRKREIECLDYFDINLLISEQEVKFLKELTGKSNVYQINPLLDSIDGKFNRKYQGNQTFVFLGALNIPHNETALLNFISSQIDFIIKLMPDFILKVIGVGVTPDIIDVASGYGKHISLEEYVEDLEAVFNESCAMIVPLIFGSGVKIKTLEALSKGLPVISTDFGVEGILIRNGIECIVENNLNLWPQIMSDLTNVNRNTEMSRRAYNFFHVNYSKEAIYKQYREFFTWDCD